MPFFIPFPLRRLSIVGPVRTLVGYIFNSRAFLLSFDLDSKCESDEMPKEGEEEMGVASFHGVLR